MNKNIKFQLEPAEEIRLISETNEKIIQKKLDGNYYLINIKDPKENILLTKNDTVHLYEQIENRPVLRATVCLENDWIQIDSRLITIASKPNKIKEIVRNNLGKSSKNERLAGHAIGDLYDPEYGHVIDGGRFPRNPKIYAGKHEVVIVDFYNDVVLKERYKSLTKKLNLKYPQLSEKEIIYKVYKSFQDIQTLSNENDLKIRKINSGLRIGPLIERLGGVCRHNSIAIAAILERLIKENYLKGKVFYCLSETHAWIIYKTPENKYYVIDRSQNNFFNLNHEPTKEFSCGDETKQKVYYIDYVTPEMLKD